MSCKYCKKTTHLIDNCPEIICKKCHIVGHPFWKCKNKSNLSINKFSNNKKTNVSPPVPGIFNRNVEGMSNGVVSDVASNAVSNAVSNAMSSVVGGGSSGAGMAEVIGKTETYADALCNADNKITYYMKYQGVRWNLMI